MRNNERGWILIDALIGVVIVAIALTALAVAYRQAAVVTISSTNQVRALNIAQDTLEGLKRYDRQTAITLPARTTVAPFTVDVAQLAVSQVNYLPKLVPVEVTVTWTEAGGANGSVRMTGYYYQQ